MTEILVQLHVIRDGDDVTGTGVEPDTFYLWQGEILTFSEQEIKNFHRKIAQEIFTPVRLEPCPTLGWRTDVENAPQDGTRLLVGWDDTSSTTQAHYDEHETEWCDDDGYYLLLFTHWMPIPALPNREAK